MLNIPNDTPAERRNALARICGIFTHLTGLALIVPGFAADVADVLPDLLRGIEELRQVVEGLHGAQPANQSRGVVHHHDASNLHLPDGRYPRDINRGSRLPSPPPYPSVAPTERAYSPAPPRDYASRSLPIPSRLLRSPVAESSREAPSLNTIRQPARPAVSTVGRFESNITTMNTAGRDPALSRNQPTANEVPPATYRLRAPREHRGLTGSFGPDAQAETNFPALHQPASNTNAPSGPSSASRKGKGRARDDGENDREVRTVARNRLQTLQDFSRWADRIEAEEDIAPLPAFLHPSASVNRNRNGVASQDARRTSPLARRERPTARENAIAGPSTVAGPSRSNTAPVIAGAVNLPPPPPAVVAAAQGLVFFAPPPVQLPWVGDVAAALPPPPYNFIPAAPQPQSLKMTLGYILN